MVHRKKKYKDKYVRAFMCGTYASLHVKESAYLRIWYIATYGSPVVLSDDNPARAVLERHLTHTDRMTYWQYTAMSGRLWKMAVEANAVNESEWLEIVLPEYVVHDGEVFKVDDSWEIYDAEIRTFKEALEVKLWQSVMKYINDKLMEAQDEGRPFKIDLTLRMFCAEHGICVEYFEQFRRAYYRYKKECREQEKESRDRVLEKRNDNLKKVGENVRFQTIKFLEGEDADGR